MLHSCQMYILCAKRVQSGPNRKPSICVLLDLMSNLYFWVTFQHRNMNELFALFTGSAQILTWENIHEESALSLEGFPIYFATFLLPPPPRIYGGVNLMTGKGIINCPGFRQAQPREVFVASTPATLSPFFPPLYLPHLLLLGIPQGETCNPAKLYGSFWEVD